MGNTPSGETPENQDQQPQQDQHTQNTEQQQEQQPEKKHKEKKDKGGNDDEKQCSLTPEQIKEMQDQEAACAACEHKCDVLEYPENISKKIDREFVLQGSGKANRWHILITSGQSFTKWPGHFVSNGNMADTVTNAATKHSKMKARISLCTRAPESDCDFEDACDLIIFPEHVKYCNVQKTQVDQVLSYHFNVLAPRYQEYLRALDAKKAEMKANGTEDISDIDVDIIKPEYTEEQLQQIQIVKDKLPIDTIKQLSKFVFDNDLVEYNFTSNTPYPKDLTANSWVFLCGHKLRDARCGVVAPIIKQQFEDVIEQVYPELDGKVEIDLITHTGGHKVAANVIIHSKRPEHFYAFYGRVFPEHVENIVAKTLIKGELLQPLTRASHNDQW